MTRIILAKQPKLMEKNRCPDSSWQTSFQPHSTRRIVQAKCNPPTTHRTGHLIYVTGAKKRHKLPMKVYAYFCTREIIIRLTIAKSL